MNRDITLLRRLPRFAVGAYAAFAVGAESAQAQPREPAATLAPARPSLSPVVVRGATPESILPSFTGPYVASVPAPSYSANAKPSWVGNKLNAVKETVIGKPAAADSRPVMGPTRPLLGTGAAPMLPPQQPLQSIYASPPAYRGYGWGGTTPGANPHSPGGIYPQGSANWYSQTGATPGAFPDTRTHPLDAPAIEPPVYSAKSAGQPAFNVGVPSKPAETKQAPRFISGSPAPEPRVVARTPIGSEMPGSPSLPSGIPTAIASSTDSRTLPEVPIALPTTELNWQTASGRGIPLPKEPDPIPQAAQPVSSDPAWGPSAAPKPATPTISVIRGQLDAREPQSLEMLIRNACVGRVARTDVRAITPQKFVVTFVAASESAARDAAALVVALPELKPYEITFEAQIVPR